ncbi:unnamed protein product [Phytophthora fragariaefolia]|uniref:Unnamed protein product n=1 Tax=Phytophthora fragariaefolia TaxID=1490495 RepID=A0A9W6YG95_9STRA|nr:unnamed protein product [Phytophthora fragariaefolia]
MTKGRQKHTNNGGRKPRAKFYKGLAGTQLRSKRTSVYLWCKQKARLVELCQSTSIATQRKVRLRGTGTTLSRDAEVHLVKWINAYRAQGLPVSSLLLHRKALAVGRDIGIPVEIFTASRGWVKGFLRRNRMSLRARTRQGQVPPQDANKALLDFNRQVKQTMAELGTDVAYNADQTPVFFDYMPKSTITTKGAHSQGRKYVPYLVIKTKPSKVPSTRTENDKKRHGIGLQLWREMKPLQARHDVVIFGNGNGWWNEKLTIDLLRFYFAARNDMTTPVLLLLDEFSGHWTDAVLACARDLNMELMFLQDVRALSVC